LKQKILLLGDDRTLVETLDELLPDDGYDVDWVIDGAEAAAQHFEQQYDLYIFYIFMI